MQVGASTRRSDLRPAVVAVAARFAVFGLVAGSWMAVAPEVKATLALSDARWGQASLAAPCGSLLSLVLVGAAVSRLGLQRVSGLAAAALLVVAPLMTAAPSLLILGTCLLCYGMAITMLNVPANGLALVVERGSGRPLMNLFHASYSVGLVLGAAACAALSALGASPTARLVLTHVAAGAWLLRTAGRLPSEAPEAKAARGKRRQPGLLGLLALFAATTEMTLATWSPIYVRQSLHASATGTAVAFSCFATAMLAGRLAGGHVARRMGRRALLACCGALAAAGTAMTLAAGETAVACLGLAVCGLGVAASLPTLVSELGASRGSETSVRGLWVWAWPGATLAPPLVGWLSSQTTLRTALLVPLVSAVCLGVGARRLPPSEARALE